ncbi:MAG: Rrf2 family transcriptional regulator [Verrucomicrobiae bacterium]|nr:Rrf2 family transcriptional regulator [Verrucomicrobiae bacterium]
MKLTSRGEYALRALAVLGLRHGQGVVSMQEISRQQNIPKRYLEHILNDLREAGLVESRRGVRGGYQLARRPEEITLAMVLRHLEGALAPVGCVSQHFYEPCSCPDEARCGIRSVMAEVRQALVQTLERFTLADVCERYRQLQGPVEGPLDFVI